MQGEWACQLSSLGMMPWINLNFASAIFSFWWNRSYQSDKYFIKFSGVQRCGYMYKGYCLKHRFSSSSWKWKASAVDPYVLIESHINNNVTVEGQVQKFIIFIILSEKNIILYIFESSLVNFAFVNLSHYPWRQMLSVIYFLVQYFWLWIIIFSRKSHYWRILRCLKYCKLILFDLIQMQYNFLENCRGGLYLLHEGFKYSVRTRRVNRHCPAIAVTMDNFIPVSFGRGLK